jgi:hypothetical protein
MTVAGFVRVPMIVMLVAMFMAVGMVVLVFVPVLMRMAADFHVATAEAAAAFFAHKINIFEIIRVRASLPPGWGGEGRQESSPCPPAVPG